MTMATPTTTSHNKQNTNSPSFTHSMHANFFEKIHNLTPFQCSQQAHNFIINEIKVATYTFTDPNVVTLYIFRFFLLFYFVCYCCCFCCSLFVTFVRCGLNTFLEVFLLIVGVYCMLYKFLSYVALFCASFLVLLQSSWKICCNFFFIIIIDQVNILDRQSVLVRARSSYMKWTIDRVQCFVNIASKNQIPNTKTLKKQR